MCENRPVRRLLLYGAEDGGSTISSHINELFSSNALNTTEDSRQSARASIEPFVKLAHALSSWQRNITVIFRQEIPNEDDKELFREPHIGGACPGSAQDMFYNSPVVHPDYWKPKPDQKLQIVKDELPKLGYHGRSKYKYAFHEPWRPLDRMTLLEQAEKEEHGGLDDGLPDKSADKQLT